MTDIGLMVRSANPVPDESQALTDDELSAVLLLAQHRSGEMDTKERTPVVATPPRRGWAIAAASFAAIVAVVGAAWLLGGGAAEEAPPATTPTTQAATTTVPAVEQSESSSTTAAPEAAPEGPTEQQKRDAVDQLLGLASSGDIDGLESSLAGAALNLRLERAGIQSTSVFDHTRRLLELESALGTLFEADVCTTGESPSRIECEVIATEAVRGALGLDGFSMLLKADVDAEGNVTWLLWQWDVSVVQYADLGLWYEELAPMVAWLEENHPGDIDQMVTQRVGREPSASEESRALWTRHVPAFIESLGSAG